MVFAVLNTFVFALPACWVWAPQVNNNNNNSSKVSTTTTKGEQILWYVDEKGGSFITSFFAFAFFAYLLPSFLVYRASFFSLFKIIYPLFF